KPEVKKSELHPSVQELVNYLFSEATDALTNTIAAKITAQGIETPLGVLTIGQIERGETILNELFQLFQAGKAKPSDMSRLSGDFYTLIPHRIGRTRAAIEDAIIDTLPEFEQKQETLQLMKDMLQVNGEEGVLYDAEIDKKAEAL